MRSKNLSRNLFVILAITALMLSMIPINVLASHTSWITAEVYGLYPYPYSVFEWTVENYGEDPITIIYIHYDDEAIVLPFTPTPGWNFDLTSSPEGYPAISWNAIDEADYIYEGQQATFSIITNAQNFDYYTWVTGDLNGGEYRSGQYEEKTAAPFLEWWIDEDLLGSWCDEMWFTIETGAAEQMFQLENHLVDACGEPSPTNIPTLGLVGEGLPTPEDIPILEAEGYSIAGTPGFGMHFYAINNRPGKEPLDDPVFRTALAYCMDKSMIPEIYGSLSSPLYNFVPPAQAFWSNPDVEAAFPRFNLQEAIDTLVGGGYTPVDAGDNPVAVPVPGNIDHWHLPGTTTDIRDLEQAVPTEANLGMKVSERLEIDFQSIGLPILHTPLTFDYIVYQQLLKPPYLNWDLAIGIGLTFGGEPVLHEMYHGDSVPFANFWGLDDQEVNDYCDSYRETLDRSSAAMAVFAAEERLLELMPMIPFGTTQKHTAFAKPYGQETGVLGWVNMKGYGGYTLWSVLFSRREYLGLPYGINNWLMDGDAEVLNPLTSDTAYEWQLLSLVYSSLYIRNPYTHEALPWCCGVLSTLENGRLQLWNGTHRTTGWTMPETYRPWIPDPSPEGSPGPVTGMYMKWWLRDDMTWHDGSPVTAYDVEFCLDLMVQQNNERYSHIQSLIWDVNVVDSYTFEIYYTGRYVGATTDISDVALLAPKHVWEPYIAGEDGILWNGDDRDHRDWEGSDWIDAYGYSAPVIEPINGTMVQLTHLIGNGPFVYPHGSWVPDTSMRLVAWKMDSFHIPRIHRGDNNFDGFTDTQDIWPAVYASGTQAGMPKWVAYSAGPRADAAHPAGLIDGRDRAAILETWGYYWWPQ